MTKRQRAEHKLNNALRAASIHIKFNRLAGKAELQSNQMTRGLVPRINRWVERLNGSADSQVLP